MQYGNLSDEFPVREPPNGIIPSTRSATGDSGDQIVYWLYLLLKSQDLAHVISEVANISAISNGIFDIIVRVKEDPDNHIRGIQVKCLSYLSANHRYKVFSMGKKYPNDT